MKVFFVNSSMTFKTNQPLVPIDTASVTYSAENGSSFSKQTNINTLFGEGSADSFKGKYLKVTVTCESNVSNDVVFASYIVGTDGAQVKAANNEYGTSPTITIPAGSKSATIFYRKEGVFWNTISYAVTNGWVEASQDVTFDYEVYDADPSNE